MSELIAAALGFAWGFWMCFGLHAKARREVARLKLALVGEEKARHLLNAGLEASEEDRQRLKQELRNHQPTRTP